MITINKIEDLMPYAKYVEGKYTNGCCSRLVFEFRTSEGGLDDVTINCDCNLIFSTDNVSEDTFCVNEYIANDQYAEYCEVYVKGQDFFINNNFACNNLECLNLTFKECVEIDYVMAVRSISGTSLKCYGVMSERLDVDYLESEDVRCVDMYAKKFKLKDILFQNVSSVSHINKDFLVEGWNNSEYKMVGASYHYHSKNF